MKAQYIIFFIILISCNSKETKLENKTATIDSISTGNANNLGAKLFLEFREKMSPKEYLTCVKNLVEQKVLTSVSGSEYYLTGNCKTLLEPVFENNALKQIELKGIECIYPLYVKKYGIPNMISKKLTQEYLENNPNYNPQYSYVNDRNQTIQLPSAFTDKSQKIKPNEKIILENNEMTKVLVKDRIEILRDSVVIIIEQEFSENPIGNLEFYSLSNSPEILEYEKSEMGKKNMGMFGIENKFITSNSKLRHVIKSPYLLTKIIYVSSKGYITEKQKSNNNQKLNQKKEKEKRNSNVINEI